ncbi:MAG: SpoIIE family protein phosphatase [Bacteroidales bacterium]|nr:SpoIIE family protein phosphatase [Bacteroidales bacterium]
MNVRLLFTLLLFVHFITHAQNYFHRVFNVENELSQNVVFSINQDNDYNLWIGTIGGGINIFNGHEFKYLTKGKLLSSNVIHHILFYKTTTIVSTDQGLDILSQNRKISLTKENGLPSNNVWVSQVDRNGIIYIGTSNGICIYKNNRIETPDFLKILNHVVVYSLYLDSQDRIWIGTSKGLYLLNKNNQIIPITKTNKESIETVWTINEDFNNNIIVGTLNGLYKIKQFTAFAILDYQTFTTSFKTEHNLFFCDYNGYLYKIYNDSAHFYKKFPVSNIRTMFIDIENSFWIGTENGLFQFPSTPFVNYNTNNVLINNNIFAISSGFIKNTLWIGYSSGGASYIEFDKYKHIHRITHIPYLGDIIQNKKNKKKLKGLIGNFVTSIITDNEDKVWFGTLTGISIFNPKDSSFTHITDFNEHKIQNVIVNPNFNKTVFHLSIDTTNIVWVSTIKGIYAFKNTQCIELPDKLKQIQLSTYYILNDKDSLWICTNEGLFLYSKKNDKLIHYNSTNGFTSSICTSIVKDKRNNYWIATKEGLYFFDKKKFININKNKGLASDNIYSIAIDTNNYWLYIGTNKGFNTLSLKNFYENKSIYIKSYTINDGFLGQECNRNAIHIDSSNTIFFGTVNGLTIFNPEAEEINKIKPKLHITSILYNFQPYKWTQYADSIDPNTNLPINLILPYNKNHLTFVFSATSLKNPDKVRYQFMLEGLDDNWSPILQKNEAVFPSLPPGSYTFLVRACNENGVWSEPVIFSFKIKPPFYKTWWFISLLVVITLLSIIAYIKYREKKLISEKNKLEAIVKERTAEVVKQKEIVEQKNKDITDSIHYAQNIQQALLPADFEIKKYFPESFIFYQPRDIVSGDFYWIYHKHNKTYFAAADCTGHGVPGAFMSILGITFLNDIVSNNIHFTANEILNQLREKVIFALKQHQAESNTKDGMDISLIIVHHNESYFEFAGANNPIYVITNNQLHEYKADKMPIGYHVTNKTFTNQIININAQTCIYLFSDGYADQFGGPQKKKFKYQSLKKLTLDVHTLPMNEQKQIIKTTFHEWKGENEQIDDILFCGICLK